MMAFHKNRWVYVYILILLITTVCIFISTKNNLSKIYRDHIEEKNLIIRVSDTKKMMMDFMQKQKQSLLVMNNDFLDTASVIDYLDHYASMQNISVSNVQLFKIKNVEGMNALPVKLNALGDFSEFVKFIFALFNGPRALIVGDFSLKRDERGVVAAELQLFILGIHASDLQ